MIDSYPQQHVFCKTRRFLIRVYLLAIILLLGFCSIFCLRLAIIDIVNKQVYILISVIFALLCCVLAFGRRTVSRYVSLKYIKKGSVIQNLGYSDAAYVDTQCPLYISQTQIEGNTRVPLSEKFYLLSNKPLHYVPNHDGNGMRVVQHLIKNGVVVIPINEDTHSVILQLARSKEIPTYPRVAFIHH